MKNILKIVTVGTALTVGLAAAPAPSYAGDREWATVGKVLTGVAAVGVLSAIIHDARPPGVYVRMEHGAPGHYETRYDRVCLPGYWTTVVEPAQYGWVRRGRHSVHVEIRPAIRRQVWVPERYEVRETRVWVPRHHASAAYVYHR